MLQQAYMILKFCEAYYVASIYIQSMHLAHETTRPIFFAPLLNDSTPL